MLVLLAQLKKQEQKLWWGGHFSRKPGAFVFSGWDAVWSGEQSYQETIPLGTDSKPPQNLWATNISFVGGEVKLFFCVEIILTWFNTTAIFSDNIKHYYCCSFSSQ